MSETANPPNTIHTISGPQKLAHGMLGSVVRSWQGTLQYDGLEGISRLFRPSGGGSLILLWHNRLFPAIGALKQAGMGGRRLYGLVSASRDGAQLSHFMEAQGILPIRGSSSRRGAVAARELVKVLADGHNVAITVDGPRGPCYQAQPGAAFLAQLTGAPLAYLGVEAEACWELNSWDHFIVPKPFSRVRVTVESFPSHPGLGGKEQRLLLLQSIQDNLSRLTLNTHLQK